MYIVFGNEIIDSSEIKDIIENNSDFNVEKDLTKGSKREDTLAYQISIDVALLNEVIKELDLKEIKTVHSRIEDFGKNKEYREKFD